MVIDWLIECKETTEDTLSNQPVSVRTLSHSTFTSFSVNVPPLRSLSICSSSWSTSGRGIVAGVCVWFVVSVDCVGKVVARERGEAAGR